MKKTTLAALAATALTAGTATLGVQAATTTSAHADPCFFSYDEWWDWHSGASWGDSLSHIQNIYTAEGGSLPCAGSWETGGTGVKAPFGHWNGHTLYRRVWARPDGQTEFITFAEYSTAPTYRAREYARSGAVRVCEGGRPSDAPSWEC